MTPAYAELCAVALYALPLIAFIGVRARRDTPLLLVALDVPLVVAVDLVGIVLLSCLVPLEVATMVSRPAWVASCAAWVWWRWRRTDAPRWPVALGTRNLVTAVAAGALAVVISVAISRHYDMWDRAWHQPQISAIAMQRIPFVNVFDSEAPLRYHYAADVYASIFRTLSFDAISATRALALTHDVAFGLIAATVAMLMLSLGQRHRWFAILGGVCMVIPGPIPFNGPAITSAFTGLMYPNYLLVSFRPHVALAGLLLTGYVGTVAGRLLAVPAGTAAPSWARLVPAAAAASLTDETSIAMLGLGLGIAWLVDPGVLTRRRTHGIAMLLAIAAATVMPSVLLGGSLAPGGPVQKLTWVAAHVPSGERDHASLPFPAAPSVSALLVDLLPFLSSGLGILVIVARRRLRSGVALFVFSASVVFACTCIAMHLEINGQSIVEMQRFFVVPFFATFVVGLVVAGKAQPGSIGTGLVALAVTIPAAFTGYWLVVVVPATYKNARLGPEIDTNCRTAVGAHFGERAQRKYVESGSYFLYSTCRPVFSPGGNDQPWPTKIFPHLDSTEQLQALDREPVGPDGAWTAVCRAGRTAVHDRVCGRLLQQPTACRPEGVEFLSCPLTPELRLSLLKP